MLKGRCPKCGLVCYGLILGNPQYQICRECGTRLEVKEYKRDDDERQPLKLNMNDEIGSDK